MILNHRKRALFLVLSLAALSAVGCGGGMVGTGTGPKEDTLELAVLPDTISPDLPAPLVNAATLIDATQSVNARTTSKDDAPVSTSWNVLNDRLSSAEAMRLRTTEMLALIDVVFDDIVASCTNLSVEVCELSSGRLSGTYSTTLVSQLVSMYTRSLNPLLGLTLDNQQYQAYIGTIEERVNKPFTFRETRYQLLDGQPFDHQITSGLSDVFPDQKITVRWNNARTAVSLLIQTGVGEVVQTRRLGYETGLPGTRISYVDDNRIGDGVSSRFDVSVLSANTDDRRVIVDAHIYSRTGDVVSNAIQTGQFDNAGGYQKIKRSSQIGPGLKGLRVTRESIDAQGRVLAMSECTSAQLTDSCIDDADFQIDMQSSGRIEADPLFFTDESLPVLTAQLDTRIPLIEGLGADVREFVVLPADSAINLDERDVYCRGIQFLSMDVYVFCTVPDASLQDVVIAIEPIDAAGERILLPDASLLLQ